MTDDYNSGWNAFKAVFGYSKHSLCKWHVVRSWKRKIAKIVSDEYRTQIYQSLVVILNDNNPSVFQRYSNGLWHIVTSPHGNTGTDMYVEALHNRLKTFYMDR